MTRQYSDSPDAVRQREYRQRQTAKLAELLAAAPAPANVPNVTSSSSPAAAANVPMHETTPPSDAGGPERFASVPFLPANDNAKDPEPIVPPTPAPEEPPKPPLTREEVAPIAKAVAAYFEMGSVLALQRHAQDLAESGINPNALAEQLPMLKAFVRTSAENVCMKYRIKFPYQDEAVVAGAIGLATYGFVGGKKKKPTHAHARHAPDVEDAEERDAVVSRGAANGARNATPASSPANEAGPPAPPMAGQPEDDS